MNKIEKLLHKSNSNHGRLCPRQVLGVRIGLAGGTTLGMEIPRSDKALLVIVETDGCFVSGIMAATSCAVRHRTLRVEDYGKIAATFVNTATGQSVRVFPRPDVRQRAFDFASTEECYYCAQLEGYQRMPDDELLAIEMVRLAVPIVSLISRSGLRVNCDTCGEEIINEREIIREGKTFCRSCAGRGYYNTKEPENRPKPRFR